MDNMDDSDPNAKISDSAYSTSCSNSQSRRSHSSKSTHSSGSSGYGGKQTTSGYNNNNQTQSPEKRPKEKELKKKKTQLTTQNDVQVVEAKIEIVCDVTMKPVFEPLPEEISDLVPSPASGVVKMEKGPELDVSDKKSGKDEPSPSTTPTPLTFVTSKPNSNQISDGFTCVISMQDGIVMYTTASVTTALGYPKDMWIGRSFMDFLHQRDRNTFASQISSGLVVVAAPKQQVDGTKGKATPFGELMSTMVCRIRRYKGLSTGFATKDRVVTFMPFQLKFYFKRMSEDDGQVTYLVIEGSPFFSAFKTPNEIITDPTPFVMKHTASGKLDYIDPESVPYLGYLPQDILNKDALQLFYPSDLMYLHQIHETIVKEGGVQRSKPYRMLAQNGDFLKLETEWSSFINPWSRKLEFVIGKHFVIEGPKNPDVFQTPEAEKATKVSKEEETKALAIKESIIRIMNEVLTKPAEMAKQHMTKRCQELASFMESLLDETPKTEEELRLEIQDTDHSYFERDSVMLGGISPHHDNNDSNTSTETPLTYNQLNYNENLQRFFDSHEAYTDEDKNSLAVCEHLKTKDIETPEPDTSFSKNFLSMVNSSGEFDEMASTSDSSTAAVASSNNACSSNGFQALRLTESLLNKHNVEMEKELLKLHRETRSSKSDREKASNESRLKKKEHLARCNAFFMPTSAASEFKPQGVKRSSKNTDDWGTNKHRCSSARTTRRRFTEPPNNPPLSATYNGPVPMYYIPAAPYQMAPKSEAGPSASQAQYQRHSDMNGFSIPYMGHQQNMNPAGRSSRTETANANMNMQPNVYSPMQCMMFGPPVFASPFMYPQYDSPMAYTIPQNFGQHQIPNTQTMGTLGLSSNNYEEACKLTIPMKYVQSCNGHGRREKNVECRANNGVHGRDISSSFAGASNRNNDANDERNKRKLRFDNSDGTNEKTDGESSYSSFYSSFFKTDSGSNEESDSKSRPVKEGTKASNKYKILSSKTPTIPSTYVPNDRKVARRKMEPPWMEQVHVTSELIYKYQIANKDSQEVLSNDKEKLKTLEQSPLVCEQLSQLYLDLQLQGVAARLTLEDGITSSSSSGEDTPNHPKPSTSKARRRKRGYSWLAMIYEEDAPMPPPEENSSSS
ncbi:period circadian protein isoform X3 [Bicyclus anynana]|uniref:Period circadian protein n=1 Tax=Bicyclus anynana TaxID=110368 RepID=A0A6J1NAY7_BICAN|nr:period circadian protein isoform X3 [Bicyclus anynana]